MYHIYPALFGGVSKVLYQLTTELSRRGHRVDVLTTDAFLYGEEERKNESGINVYRSGLLSKGLARKNMVFPDAKFAFWAKNLIRNCDCVHLHGYRNPYSLAVYHYAGKYHVPYFLQAHGSLPRDVKKAGLEWFYDVSLGYRLLMGASTVIAFTQREAQQYLDIGVVKEKIKVIPNGLDLSEYVNLPSEGTFKRKFGLEADEKIILYLGRIHRSKGIGFLIRAFAHLAKTAGVRDVRLVIAGGDDGYLNEAKMLRGSVGLAKEVLFTNALSEEDKLAAYVDSTVCAYLGPDEPFGLVPLEAGLCSKPVIVSSSTFMAEIVERCGFGFAVRYGDVKALAGMMQNLVCDRKLAACMGLRGRSCVQESFDFTRAVDSMERLYLSSLSGNQNCP